MAQVSKIAPSPPTTTVPTFYRPREFQLDDLEGLSSHSIEVHLQLYRAHVERANGMLVRRAAARHQPPEDRAASMAEAGRGFVFDYNGMVLHELFFEGLTTALGTFPVPDGHFSHAAEHSFGGVDAWKRDLHRLAQTPRPGWVLCARERPTQRIFNVWIDQHGVGLPARTDPLLVLDLWEHAWLADYLPSERTEYVEMLLTQTDWQVVEQRFR